MSRWFRHYAGMMRDDKLVRCAIRSKQPVERVVWVWGAILESAAEADDAGRYDFDAAEAAYFLRADEADVRAVEDALAAAGHVDAGRVVKWNDRQFQSDKSAERQARYRDKRRGASGDGDDKRGDGVVTAPSRDSDAPETDTQTEAETERKPPPHSEPGAGAIDLFDEIWETFPRNPRSSREAARRAFKAFGSAEQGGVLPAAQRYAKWFPEDCVRRKRSEVDGIDFVPKLSTWLSNGSWREAVNLSIKGESTGPVVAMIRVDQVIDPELFAECGRVRDKPTPNSPWSFAVDVVEAARSNLKAKAAA